VGRICHWSEGEYAPDPPAEAAAVTEARNRAIALLDSAAVARPGDTWVAGQRVRLLVDAADSRAAVAAAHACTGDSVWCAELTGYALHNADEYPAADSAFNAALARMTRESACAWEDMSELLDGPLATRYARANCAEREALARRIWWLAAPLYLVSTVDARTEYYARLTRARMADDEPASELFGWDGDARRTGLRYGWSTWYSQDPPSPGEIVEPAIVGHERAGAYDFFPDLRALDSLGRTDSSDWHLTEPRAASAYAPPRLRSLHALPMRIARFRRDSSLAIVASWDARGDTTISRAGLTAGLFVGTGPDSTSAATLRGVADMGAMATLAPHRPALVSVELLDSLRHRAARARRGVVPLGDAQLQISDMLPLRARPAEPRASLHELANLASGARADSALFVYYELYTPPSDTQTVTMELRVRAARASWTRRLARRLHLSHAPSAITLRWTEHAAPSGTTPRTLRLELSELEQGSYDVELVATRSRDSAVARSAMELEVGVPL
jgi:hypothetical protein